MIKNVYGSGRYLTTTNNQATNYMNNFSGAQGLGNMQFNTTNQRIEVWDGQMWQPILMSDVSLMLTHDAVEAIAWADQKRQEEMKIKELAERHPAVADQMAAVREAEEKLRMITLLVQT
jgi:hypothetical protein